MKSFWRILALGLLSIFAVAAIFAQTPAITALLTRARSQEQSGHIDLAAQTWQQILLLDARDRDALAGLARWAKLAGHDPEAAAYLDRLRQVDPQNPQIAAIQATSSTKVQTEQLQQAATLAREGKTAEALRLYRSVWGSHPPEGDWALAFYDTEASLESDRPDAIANLRQLAKKFPADPRYTVTLGRILTYSPQTRPEGMHLLAQLPQNPSAQQALHQAELWNSKSTNPEDAAQQRLRHEQDAAAAAKTSDLWAAVQRGTQALSENRTDEAIASYKAALALRPNTPEALNGLAGAYMRANQPAQAITAYHQILKLQPNSADAWRGLFDAQLQANQPAQALETAQHLPPALKLTLQHDRAYLRSLATAYIATGQSSEAENTLAQALSLPLANGHTDIETRLQYAALLADSKRLADAAALYRQVLYDDADNLSAWQGLISIQHQANRDADAIATVERMSPATYDAALDDTGFLTLLATIYQQQSHFDLALELLQRAARADAAQHKPAPVQLQIQIAAVYLQQNHPDKAYDLFRRVLAGHPESTVAWKGLITTLHQTQHDRDALAQLRQMPANIRHDLDRDIEYTQAVASVYAATGNNAAALQLIAQIQQHFRAQNTLPPADIDLQNAWLLYNTHDDRDLYRALMALGDRDDLSDPQRRSAQNIWATWSVRRAGDAVDAGNLKRSLEILHAASLAFPDNPDVLKAMAAGYLKSGEPRQAMSILLKLDLTNASASDYQSMISAALATPDIHQAELWLHSALDKFSNDPGVLALAARFEEARGDHARASTYWKASLAAAPAIDPANRLAHTLDIADAPAQRSTNAGLPGLLDPENDAAAAPRPALPGYRNSSPSQQPYSNGNMSALYGPDPYTQGVAPVPMEPSIPRSRTASNNKLDSSLDSTSFADSTYSADAFAPPDLLKSQPSVPATLATQLTEQASPTLLPNSPLRLLGGGPFSSKPIDTPLETGSSASTGSAATATALYLQPQSVPLLRPLDSPRQNQLLPSSTSLTQQTGISEDQLQQQSLPPLRGPWMSQRSLRPNTDPADQRGAAEQQIASFEARTSPWNGTAGYVTHRSGTPGFDELYILEAPFESSTTLGGNARLTAIVTPSFLASGASTGTSTTYQLGSLIATAIPAQQNASGVGGEVQLATSNFGLSMGTTPRGFLVPNITGHLSLHPAASPLHLDLAREAVKDSQLSYSGLNDPGSSGAASNWGGVVSNAANLQFGRGNEQSGYYAGLGGQYITGLNVLANKRIDGVAGAYWKLAHVPGAYDVTLGANFFGMHYDHNLRYFTYGQGGYFSPSIYFLASIPFSIKGQYGENLHYEISGALGLQAFQEDKSLYYPLQTGFANGAKAPTSVTPRSSLPAGPILPVPVPFVNFTYPSQSVIGSNYDLHAEVSQHVIDRWYIGGFVALNNTRNYANQTVGFFLRYMSRPQSSNVDTVAPDAPTGIFPYSGPRPLLVP